MEPKTTCEESVIASIPEALKEIAITSEFLKALSVCDSGFNAFNVQFSNGTTYIELRKWLAAENHLGWENWIKSKIRWHQLSLRQPPSKHLLQS